MSGKSGSAQKSPRESFCLVIGHQTHVDKNGSGVLFHAHPSDWGGIVQFHESDGFNPEKIPEGSLIHIRSSKIYGLEGPQDIIHVTPPQRARVVSKLGGGSWRAHNDITGDTFEFSEKGDRFLPAGSDWPKVGAEITYHQTPTERFAIMARQKMPLFVSSGHYNVFLPHGAAIPTPEQIGKMNGEADRERERANNNPLVIAKAIFGTVAIAAAPIADLALKATVACHRLEPRHSFWLPEGYGRKGLA